jgi:hypothetical protein
MPRRFALTTRHLLRIGASSFLILFLHQGAFAAQNSAPVVIFQEPEFPAADSGAPSPDQLKAILPGALFANLESLRTALKDPSTRLCILPYGSAFPEDAWPELFSFLKRGGNLFVLGGRPFTRAAYKDSSGWHLREYSVRFIQELLIDQYQTTPGSEGLAFEANPDVVTKLPRFSWRRAFSPIIRLSEFGLYPRGGTAGFIDSRLDALAWGTRDGRKLSAPAIQIDHIRDGFSGGRWIFLNADLGADFYSSPVAGQILTALVDAALHGSENFSVTPVLPLYLADEPIELEVQRDVAAGPSGGLTARIRVASELDPSKAVFSANVSLPQVLPVTFRIPGARGFYVVSAELYEGAVLRAIYHSGFWIHDEAYLRSGPRLTVNPDYFELDGKPLAVVGTTYMASDVQRLYFDHPNVYVWDRDLSQISAAGLNMIRTGWWTGWDKFCDENGKPYERTLRTLEAYLMTARKYSLPVQFNFFAFLPDVLGGANAYLDLDAVRRQKMLIGSVTARFRDVPFLAWDLINEPSFSKYLWRTRPNGDWIEAQQWNAWLNQRYPDRKALADAWNLPAASADGSLPVPTDAEFDPRGMYTGANSLKIYDFMIFAQESFAAWAKQMRDTIRSSGAQQPITVGQDEGGYTDRLTPAFFGPAVDFTTNHSWWQNDALLWDSLVAKQPGLPMLIQETGLQRELTLDEIARRTPENDAALFERKVAMSFVQGSGAIEWLWNTNSYMTEGNEVPIGALRTDATEKPEATVMRAFAAFSKVASPALRKPERPQVAILTSQAAQFSDLVYTQVAAQQNSVRALAYYARVPGYVIAENQIAKLGSPKLVILPSAQSLAETTWQALLHYVDGGGNLLITGSIARNEHWHRVLRAKDVHLQAQVEPLTFHNAEIRIKDRRIPLSFDQNAQTWLEYLRFQDGASFVQIPHGKGVIFWAAYPVELAQGLDAAASVYSAVLADLGIAPPFELKRSLSPGVLVYPTALQDATLYVITSESDDDSDIDLIDKRSGGRLTLHLTAQHAALALIRKSDGVVEAKYGF